MANQNVIRGAFLVLLSLFFGLGAFRYPIGSLSSAGAGLFPLLVSSLLLFLAVLTLIQARVSPAVPLYFNVKNIIVIMLGLTGFVVGSKFINMMVGIVLLVFVASFAATSFSWKRNIQVSIGLILIAIAFQKLLGLNLRVI